MSVPFAFGGTTDVPSGNVPTLRATEELFAGTAASGASTTALIKSVRNACTAKRRGQIESFDGEKGNYRLKIKIGYRYPVGVEIAMRRKGRT